MRKTVKKYFIPQQENNHKPHFLRAKALGVVAIFVFLVEVAFFANVYFFSNKLDYLASVLPGVLVSLTNENRVEDNLGTLSTNPVLQLAAQMKADDMATKGYFAHTSPDGREPWYWLNQAGYNYSYAGENLAVDFVDSGDVTKAWMKSPTHRANMINQHYTEIGIAVASGVYKGKSTLFVVQFFGAPKKVVTALSVPTAPVISTKITAPATTPVKSVPASSVPAKTSVAVVNPPVNNAVLGTETKASVADAKPIVPTKFNSLLRPLQKIMTSPRQLSDYVFGALILLLTIVLSLTIFIAIRIQHPNTIAGAMAMIVLVAGVIYFNNTVFKSSGVDLPSDTTASVIQAF